MNSYKTKKSLKPSNINGFKDFLYWYAGGQYVVKSNQIIRDKWSGIKWSNFDDSLQNPYLYYNTRVIT